MSMRIVLTLSLVVALSGVMCGKKKFVTNPQGTPQVTFSPGSVADSDTLSSDTVTVSWTGNSNTSEFRYRFDTLAWSPWSTVSSVSEILDDGVHVLEVSTRFQEETDTTIRRLSFTVDALAAPAVSLSPRSLHVSGDTARLAVVTKGLSQCKLLHLKIAGVTPLDTRLAVPADSVAFKAHEGAVIDIIVGPGGAPLPANGSVVLFSAAVDSSDTTVVGITECVAHDSSGAAISVKTVRGGIIVR